MTKPKVFNCKKCGQTKRCKEKRYENVEWCNTCCHKAEKAVMPNKGFLWGTPPQYVLDPDNKQGDNY